MKEIHTEKEKLEMLNGIIYNIEMAHWGGFRARFDDEDIRILNWGIEKLKETIES